MKEIHRQDEEFRRLFPPVVPKSGISYVPSQFVLPFEYRGESYLFNTLTRQCIAAFLPARAETGEGFDALIGGRFLVPSGMDERAFFLSVTRLLKTFHRKNVHPAYTILPTLGCNARCVYCFEEGMRQIGMTDEVVEDSIRFILDDCGGRKLVLSWFGGEPLLRQDVIDRISLAVRDAGVEYKGLMITNGSLITPEVVQKMKDVWNLESIQISMDGAEADYIARKRYLADQDQYHAVIDAVERISAAGIDVMIRCNVDEDNLERVPQFLEDLSAGIEHKKNVSLYLVPLYQIMHGERDLEIWPKLLEMQRMIRSYGFALTFERFSSKICWQRCMADGNGIVIAPDGSLHCCEDLPEGSRIGSVREGITDPNARRIFTDPDREPEKCRTCPFLPDCMPVPSCPNYETHCREAHELLTLDVLHRIIDRKEDNETADADLPINEGNPVC